MRGGGDEEEMRRRGGGEEEERNRRDAGYEEGGVEGATSLGLCLERRRKKRNTFSRMPMLLLFFLGRAGRSHKGPRRGSENLQRERSRSRTSHWDGSGEA